MNIESEIFCGAAPEIPHNMGYEDVKLLRITANAKLYRATRQGKYFLLKTTKDNTAYQQRLLQREYDLSIGCDHPHIVHIYMYEPNLPIGDAIVMEYLECRTLAEYLSEQPSKMERERLFEQLLFAVEYLHKRGVIHNDLKPENILVTTADNNLKLVDFGLADSDAEAVLRQLGCTPRYASPELRARRGVDSRSDIYSLGVILCEMLGVSAVARRCMAEMPDDRFANVEALRHAWKNRYRGWRILRNLFLTLVVIAPMVLYLVSNDVERRRVEARDRMIEDMEAEMTAICDAVIDSVADAKYMEFAGMHFRSMYEQCDAVYRRYFAMTDDVALQSQLTTRYGYLYNEYSTVLTQRTSAYPSFYVTVRGAERDYLDSLLKHRLPYAPHTNTTAKDNKRQ